LIFFLNPMEIACLSLLFLLKGEGAYTGQSKDIILTIVNTFQIKRIEEITFSIDPDAFLITENTFNVLGKGFSQRKVY
jgi:uncharacterized membrane-anchored protein YitT (DUF2179 family)